MPLPLRNPLHDVDPVKACAPYRPLPPPPGGHVHKNRPIVAAIGVIVAILSLAAWFYVTISTSNSPEDARVTETASSPTGPGPGSHR